MKRTRRTFRRLSVLSITVRSATSAGRFKRVAEDAGRDRRESDGFYCSFLGERVTVAVRQELVLGAILAVDWSQGVYDVAVGQAVAAGHDGLPRLYRTERPGLLREFGTGGGVDRAGDPSPALESCVGRVHDSVHVSLGRYVSLYDLNLYSTDHTLHFSTTSLRGLTRPGGLTIKAQVSKTGDTGFLILQ